jgi:hypothetical protein
MAGDKLRAIQARNDIEVADPTAPLKAFAISGSLGGSNEKQKLCSTPLQGRTDTACSQPCNREHPTINPML